MVKEIFMSILSITLSSIGAFFFCIGLTKISELKRSSNYKTDLKILFHFCIAVGLLFLAILMAIYK